jgi:hypothetical protein
MFFQLLYIHLFRPFLKYNPNNSPLPAHVSPRKLCTQAAAMISKLLRLYKRSHGLRQICNICVYIAHSACTIHLLNLPEKNAKRDIIHGVKHLEEIAEGWLCARRTLGILSVLAKRWKVEMPEEAAAVLSRTDTKFGPWNEISTPKATCRQSLSPRDQQPSPADQASPSLQPYSMNMTNIKTPQFFNNRGGPNNSSSVSNDPSARPSSTHSIPPSDANALAYTRTQHHAGTPQNSTSAATFNAPTPASTQGRRSIDAGQTTAGNSPSQLFGGVDQLMREGQDWIYQDQAQLATDFENWHPQGIDDIASWFASTTSPVGGFTSGGNPQMGLGVEMSGGPVGGGAQNGYSGVNGNPNLNGVVGAGPNGMGMPGFTYDEQSWYQ